jgi:hypothetical protein
MFRDASSKFSAVPFRWFSFNTYDTFHSSVFPCNMQKVILMQIILHFKSHIISMASTSNHLNEENVLDILNKTDECLISDSSDDGDAEEEGQGTDTDYNSGFIWEDMDNYN